VSSKPEISSMPVLKVTVALSAIHTGSLFVLKPVISNVSRLTGIKPNLQFRLIEDYCLNDSKFKSHKMLDFVSKAAIKILVQQESH
jgi:hypothetical protein